MASRCLSSETPKISVTLRPGKYVSNVAASFSNDALTASASGLDPHISPAYARLQVDRVAVARGLDSSAVAKLVESRIHLGDLGYLGEPTVNVLELNIALAKLDKGAG